jgi:hypothetical protein
MTPEHIIIDILGFSAALSSGHTFDRLTRQSCAILFKKRVTVKRHMKFSPTIANHGYPQSVVIWTLTNFVKR